MRRAAVLLLLLLSAAPAWADEDHDLDLIPGAAPAVASAPATNARWQNYLEDALSVSGRRSGLAVPFPAPAPPTWQNRLFLDSRDEFQLGRDVTFTYSGRLNLRVGDGLPFPSHENLRNDLRELYIGWKPDARTWLDLGRINVKSGAALGYNPTDFFRTRAVVEALTADPSVLRDDRLGTLMVMGQRVWQGGSVTAAYAPRVTLPTAIYGYANLPTIDPMLDRTNAADRFLLKTSLDVVKGFNPELLIYHQDNRTQIGGNLTMALGQQTIAYAEWAGGERASLIHDAYRYGTLTRTLPASSLALLPNSSSSRFQNDLSLGASFTPAGTNITVNAEYHYHQAGLTASEWRTWFDQGKRLVNVPGATNALWYLRSYAQDQQEPMAQHRGFVRVSWTDALVKDLNLTALATVNLQDGSFLAQATADYFLSRNWTLGGLVTGTAGARRSEFGSLPQTAGALVRLIRYL